MGARVFHVLPVVQRTGGRSTCVTEQEESLCPHAHVRRNDCHVTGEAESGTYLLCPDFSLRRTACQHLVDVEETKNTSPCLSKDVRCK